MAPSCIALTVVKPGVNNNKKLLVVGATGTMGLQVIQGFLDVGFQPQQLKVMTRNAIKPKMVELKRLGFGIVQANLEDKATLQDACEGCSGCYIHSTSNDTHDLDLKEVTRARNLCAALCSNPGNVPVHFLTSCFP